MTKLKVGDTLYQPPTRWQKEGRTHIVTRVGRKWAELEHDFSDRRYPSGRVDMEDMCLDGGSHGRGDRLYASKAAHEAAVVLREAWDSLVIQFRNTWGPCPKDMTVEKIRQVRHILGGSFLPKDETQS